MNLSMIPVGTVLKAKADETLAPKQRLHLVLLGVRDVARAASFYESLGWQRSPTGHAGFVKFDLGGYALCLLPRDDFAKDALAGDASSSASGFAGVGFVYLAKSVDEVARILARAEVAGGRIVKPATRTAWGVAGYFQDLDGHLFEVDYEECWVFDADDRLLVDKLHSS